MAKNQSPTAGGPATKPQGNRAVVLIDFENITIPLERMGNNVVSVIVGILALLKSAWKCEIEEILAFADWVYYPVPKGTLRDLGITCRQVGRSSRKNSADVALAMVAQKLLSERADIDTVVIIAGDRDYLPVATAARERGWQVIVASCVNVLSGDLFNFVGPDNVLILDDDGRVSSFRTLENMALYAAVDAYLYYKPRYGSVLLRGFLVDRLAKALPAINHAKRKMVFDSLVQQGLIRTWEVMGSYGEIMVVFAPNEEHADVRQLLREMPA